MLGSTPITAVLGAGVDNTDHDAVRAFIRAACDAGLALLLIAPESKVPVDCRSAVAKNRADKEASAAAQAAGRADWRTVKSASGLALATTDKAVVLRYLEAYLKMYADRYPNGVPVNLAVEVGRSRLVVVDCDTAGQMARWQQAAEIPADVPPTVVTPGQLDPATGEWAHSDGGHYYFTVPEGVELPTTLGAMTWGGDDGFAVLWDRRYVLVPPSTRPEGRYEVVGRDYPLPAWLAADITTACERRWDRANASREAIEADPDTATAIDAWAAGVSWADILEPLGWTMAPRADGCGCPVWTAPGVHASSRSATAHDEGCSMGRYSPVNAPLHIWTDNPAPPFADFVEATGPTSITKLRAVALVGYQGNIGKAMDDMGVKPVLALDDDLSPRHMPDGGMDGTGDFDAAPADPPHTPSSDSADTPHTASSDTAGPASAVDGLHLVDNDLPGIMATDRAAGDTTDSPYRDDVEAEPDVFVSACRGVPRIAPFSHWRDMPPPAYVVEGLVEHGGLSCLLGPPGMGKSTVALDMACHIAVGKRWQGFRVLKTRVLYLPGEGLSGAVQRVRAWEEAHGVSLGDDLLMGDSILQAAAPNEAWADIAQYVAAREIGLVIFDTFARATSGLEENSATEVGKAVRRFDRLKDLTSCGVMVVHHTGKGDPSSGRGSSALNAALDSELLVRHATWDVDAIVGSDGRLPGKPIELWTNKQKNMEQRDTAIPLLLSNYEPVGAAIITGPGGGVDPMDSEVVLAPPLPEPLVELAIRMRAHIDRFPTQGCTRSDLVLGIRPDRYALQRADSGPYWKQRVAEAVDLGLRYSLLETLTGTASGSRYIPSLATPDQARAQAAAEAADAD